MFKDLVVRISQNYLILIIVFQLKKLMSKVLSRDVLYYRKLTDISAEEKSKLSKDSDPSLDLEQLAKGF